MILPTGMPRNSQPRSAFTLVELLLVMAILVVMMALVAPALSHTLRGQKLKEEATRFVALTEYARSEAVSQGVSMSVWVDAKTGKFGLDPKNAYYGSTTHKEYTLDPAVHFDSVTGQSVPGGSAIEYTPGGVCTTASASSIRMTDRDGATLSITKDPSGWGYAVAQ